MDYTIISIDDSRTEKKNKIRDAMGEYFTEVNVDFVLGRDPKQLFAAKTKWHDVDTPGPFKSGEFGVFYSILNVLEYGANNDGIVYFEDDAIATDELGLRLSGYIQNLPEDWDLFAIWSPQNQWGDYSGVSGYNKLGEPIYGRVTNNIFDVDLGDIVKLWQGYGNVSMAFSKQGCKKLLDHIKAEGFYSPVDCLICIATHRNMLNGYALKPRVPVLLNYDWEAPTTVHTTQWGYIQDLMEGETMNEMALIIPSRGRPGNIRRWIQAIRDTRASVDVYVGIDDDDPFLSEYMLLKDEVNIIVGPRERFGPTLNRIALEIADNYEYIMWAGDDHKPVTLSWDFEYRKVLKQKPVAIVYGNDLVMGPAIPTQMAMTSSIVKTLGYAVPVGFVHLYIDNYFLELGNALNMITYLPDVVVQHLHPVAGKAQEDQTYIEANSPENWTNDRIRLEKYLSEELAVDVKKLEAYSEAS
jgi:hypothetical protein